MPHLEPLAAAQAEVNPPHVGDWPHRIGSFMLNFGAVEFASYQFLNALEPTRAAFETTVGQPVPGLSVVRITNQ